VMTGRSGFLTRMCVPFDGGRGWTVTRLYSRDI
jgi:hypothetical protein